MSPSLTDSASKALFALPPGRLADALGRLPPGRLWESCFPGMDPAGALRMLGRDARMAFAEAARGWTMGDGAALSQVVGLPFEIDTSDDLAALGAALLSDARTLSEPRPRPPDDDGGTPEGPPCTVALDPDLVTTLGDRAEFVADPWTWRIEIVHRGRSEWKACAEACLDHAASEALSGRMPDTVDALLHAPGCSLSPLVTLADADDRLRFVEALADAIGPGVPMERFRLSPFRRSAASGLIRAVAAKLEGIPGGRTGRDEAGWPVWWRASGDDLRDMLSAVPSSVLSVASAVRIGVPGGAT